MKVYRYVHNVTGEETERRAHVMIKHKLNFDQLVEILASEEAGYGALSMDPVTKDSAHKLVQEHLRAKGDDGRDSWTDERDEDDVESFRELAREFAVKYWGKDFGIPGAEK